MTDERRDVAAEMGTLLLRFYGEFRHAEGPYERSRLLDDYTDDIRTLLREPSVGREPFGTMNARDVDDARRVARLMMEKYDWCEIVPVDDEFDVSYGYSEWREGTPSDSPEREAPPSAEDVECSECGVTFRDDFKPVCPSCGPLEPVRRFGATPPEEASEGDIGPDSMGRMARRAEGAAPSQETESGREWRVDQRDDGSYFLTNGRRDQQRFVVPVDPEVARDFARWLASRTTETET